MVSASVPCPESLPGLPWMVDYTLCTEMNSFLPRLFITATEGKLERWQTDNSREKVKGAMATGILVNVTCEKMCMHAHVCACVLYCN